MSNKIFCCRRRQAHSASAGVNARPANKETTLLAHGTYPLLLVYIVKSMRLKLLKSNDKQKYTLRNTQAKWVVPVKDILSAITAYREARGWTEYQLAERSGLPQSTISPWYRKNMVPTIPSLEKICMAFGITLSQLFAEKDEPVSLTEPQRELLERWSRLSEEQQAAIFALIDKM